MKKEKNILFKDRVVIASVYIPPLPGSPSYEGKRSIEELIDEVYQEVKCYKDNGVDGVVIGNQKNRPWLKKCPPETISIATKVIIESVAVQDIPFGISLFWDPFASLAVAKATGAQFVRGIFGGAYAGNMGFMEVNSGEVSRHRKRIEGPGIKILAMLRPITCSNLDDRSLVDVARDFVKYGAADGITLCGATVGQAPSADELKKLRDILSDKTPLFVNNGVNKSNVEKFLNYANGIVIASSLKTNGKPDPAKISEFMSVVKGE